jgi:hypothetical protein
MTLGLLPVTLILKTEPVCFIVLVYPGSRCSNDHLLTEMFETSHSVVTSGGHLYNVGGDAHLSTSAYASSFVRL